MFEPCTGDRSDDVCETWPSGDESEGSRVVARLVEVLGGDSRGDLMNGRDTREPSSTTIQKVHDVATGYEETVRIALVNQQICEQVRIGVAAVSYHATKLGEPAGGDA